MSTMAPERTLEERLADLQQRSEKLADDVKMRVASEEVLADYWPATEVQKFALDPGYRWVDAAYGGGHTDHFLEDPDGSRVRVGWKYQPVARPTGGQVMSTMVLEAPLNGAATTKEAMREVLDERAAQHDLGDRLRSLPQRARAYVASTFRYLRLNRASDTFNTAWERVRPILARILGPIRVIGILNIIGALLTAQSGREIVRSAVHTVARVVSWPFRMAARFLGWVGRKVGLGGAVAETEFQWIRAKIWMRTNFENAMNWLDEREHHGAMRWGRSFFQTAIGGRLISRYAPQNLRGLLWVAFLFVPNLGVGPNNDIESKLSVIKDTVPSDEAKTTSTTDAKVDPQPKAKVKTEKTTQTKTTVEGPQGTETKVETTRSQETITKEKFTLLNGKKATALKITAADGSVTYKMNGQDYTEESIAAVVREISANDPEAMPQMNRAVRRLIEQGKLTEEEAAKLTPEQIAKL